MFRILLPTPVMVLVALYLIAIKHLSFVYNLKTNICMPNNANTNWGQNWPHRNNSNTHIKNISMIKCFDMKLPGPQPDKVIKPFDYNPRILKTATKMHSWGHKWPHPCWWRLIICWFSFIIEKPSLFGKHYFSITKHLIVPIVCPCSIYTSNASFSP